MTFVRFARKGNGNVSASDRTRRAGEIAVAVARAALAERVTFLAASIAYYAFVSFVPLLILALTVGTLVGGEGLAALLVDAVDDLLTPSGQELLREALAGGAGQGGVTAASFVVILWSGLRVFRGLDVAFAQVYDTDAGEGFVDSMVNAVTVLVAVGFGFVAVVIAGLVPFVVPGVPHAGTLSTALMFASLVLVFFPFYYVFPGVDVSAREALPGALVAAVGWALLGALFRIYAASAGAYAVYGVLGGVVLLVTWLYFGAIVVLVGAVLNAVLEGRKLSRLQAPISEAEDR